MKKICHFRQCKHNHLEWNDHCKYKQIIQYLSLIHILYDCIRIDHFRGFDEYYSIPAGDETAEHGHWEPGPGMSLMQALKDALGNVNVIAEDLGFLTDGVRRLLYDSGFPGMKVIQFAFDSREESDYLPHNYEKNCVAVSYTHLAFMKIITGEEPISYFDIFTESWKKNMILENLLY